MAGLRFGNGTAKALIRLRVILAGEGVVREERGSFRATLPGAGHMVEIDDRAGTALVLNAKGSPVSAEMDLANEAAFVSFMHNVDHCMAGEGRIPTYLLHLADEYVRACAEGDVALASIVSEGHVELPVPPRAWTPGPALHGLAAAARRSPDPSLLAAADEAIRLADGRGDPAPGFTDEASQMRWLDTVERWASADAAVHGAGDSAWHEIRTRSGLTSAARKVGHGLGAVLTSDGGERLAFGDVTAFALRDGEARVVAIGVVHDGRLLVRAGPGREAYPEAVEELMRQACPDRASPGGP